jgi:hypothetical protein
MFSALEASLPQADQSRDDDCDRSRSGCSLAAARVATRAPATVIRSRKALRRAALWANEQRSLGKKAAQVFEQASGISQFKGFNFFRRRCEMKTYVKRSVMFAALALAMLAVVNTASAQRIASDKARGYYGPAASPEPADAMWITPGVRSEPVGTSPGGLLTNQSYAPARSFSYAPRATVTQPAPAAAPQPQVARSSQPAPAAAAPAASAPVRRYSYQPTNQRVYRGSTIDRVLGTSAANRDAAAKAQGEY